MKYTKQEREKLTAREQHVWAIIYADKVLRSVNPKSAVIQADEYVQYMRKAEEND